MRMAESMKEKSQDKANRSERGKEKWERKRGG